MVRRGEVAVWWLVGADVESMVEGGAYEETGDDVAGVA